MNKRRPPASKPTRKPAGKRSVLWRRRRGLFLGGLAGVAAFGGVASIAFHIDLPPTDVLIQTSFVCAADVSDACGPENAIANFSAVEDRVNIPINDVPQVLVDAVLATEDRSYFRHGGVDPAGIARALYHDLRGSSRVQQGGSTITQQYVKNAYLTSERSISRKIKEAVLAVKLEQQLDKRQILERYLNTIYFGRGAYGVGAASRAYFGKDVTKIGLPEASYLAGLIRSPGSADAQDDPTEATRRRGTVLSAMREEGYASAEEAASVDAMGWEYVIPRRDRRKLQLRQDWQGIGAEYFIEAVRLEIADRYGEDLLYGGGLRIYTTLDHDMQAAAWSAVNSTLDRPDDPAAALVALDEFGQVKAMIGGRDFEAQQVNLALGQRGGGSGRQAGSAFKPFVLAEAIRQGISLNSKFEAPARLVLPRANAGKDWIVRNYGETEQGVLDLVDATRVSSNSAYAQLMLEVGPAAVANLASDLGIRAQLPVVNSLVLGTGEVSVLDMATGFSTFANRGVHNTPTLIQRVDQIGDDGKNLRAVERSTPSADRVLTQQEADLVTYCLRKVVTEGTARAANIGTPVAGKTGTTQTNRDAWFVGYSPTLTAAVWMGYVGAPGAPVRFMDDVHGQPVTGGSFPAQIWAKFMREATKGSGGTFKNPAGFPGRELNPTLELATTTTTSTTDPSATTSTTEPSPTTTRAPAPTATTPSTTKPKPPQSTTSTTPDVVN
ncbi:MAG: transglycosylase domain-containing protein [Acidimicrobiales bacterium]